MRFLVEMTFAEFGFWGGAVEVINRVNDNAEVEVLVADELETICDEQTMTETDVNDWLWFECEEFLEELGWTYDYDNDEWIHNED